MIDDHAVARSFCEQHSEKVDGIKMSSKGQYLIINDPHILLKERTTYLNSILTDSQFLCNFALWHKSNQT